MAPPKTPARARKGKSNTPAPKLLNPTTAKISKTKLTTKPTAGTKSKVPPTPQEKSKIETRPTTLESAPAAGVGTAKLKRKRTTEAEAEAAADSDSAKAASTQDVFRRHFELAFAPLPEREVRGGGRTASTDGQEKDLLGDESGQESEDDEDTIGEDSFEGFLDDKDDVGDDGDSVMGTSSGVEVVDHSGPAAIAETMTKQASRAFMSARPPSPTSSKRKLTTTPSSSKSTHPEDSAELLANDIALQRLLSESHLLLQQSSSTHPIFSASLATHTAPTPKHKLRADAHYDPALFRSGKARLRATDMRLRALGAAGGSLYARPKTGRSVGTVRSMADAEREREDRRRREAKEAGIVLERRGGKSGSLVGMDKKRRKR